MIDPRLLPGLLAARDAAPGCSAKDLVRRSGKVRLYRYRPLAQDTKGPPLLIVYALVNRPYMMDLEENRSLIRELLKRGVDVYLVDWGYPDGADRATSLADYVDGELAACVEHVLAAHRIDDLNLLGVCQGGVLSLCYTALHPQRVRNLVTMVTPVDFHTPRDLLSKWARKIDVAAFVGRGNVAGDALNALFLALMPFRLAQQKYVDLWLGDADPARLESFMRVERWIFDSPDQAGAAFREFVTWCYQENRLIRGTLEIGDRRVDLKKIVCPVLNIVAARDHIVPREASLALRDAVGSNDYRLEEFPLGHIGLYVSARARREVPAAIADWLAARA